MIQQSKNENNGYFLRQPEIPDIRQTLSISSFLNKDMIHVCFCFQDNSGRYSRFPGTVMLSLLENHTPPVTVNNRSHFARQYVDTGQPREIYLHR